MSETARQLIASSAATSALYVVFGVAYLLVARINRCFDLTPGAAATMGAYTGLAAGAAMGGGLVVAVLSGALVGSAGQWGLMTPLRARGRSASQLFLVSLGAVVVVESAVRMRWGSAAMMYPGGSRVLELCGARLTVAQVAAILTACGLWCAVTSLQRWTGPGRIYRAVVDDRDLAVALGLPVRGAERVAGAASGATGGLAGMLLALQIGATPSLGFRSILYGVIVGVISGGRQGAVLGVALLMGFTEGMVGWFLGGMWKETFVFGLFLSYLLLRDLRASREAR